MPAIRILLAGALFFALVFAAGFALGTAREILVRPYLGPNWSRIAEMPLMIGISWIAAAFVVRRFSDRDPEGWFAVGLLAFGLLTVAEMLLGWIVLRTTPVQFLASFLTLAGFLGLVAQTVLIIFPAIIAIRDGQD